MKVIESIRAAFAAKQKPTRDRYQELVAKAVAGDVQLGEKDTAALVKVIEELGITEPQLANEIQLGILRRDLASAEASANKATTTAIATQDAHDEFSREARRRIDAINAEQEELRHTAAMAAGHQQTELAKAGEVRRKLTELELAMGLTPPPAVEPVDQSSRAAKIKRAAAQHGDLWAQWPLGVQLDCGMISEDALTDREKESLGLTTSQTWRRADEPTRKRMEAEQRRPNPWLTPPGDN
jgi:hypothetical protein